MKSPFDMKSGFIAFAFAMSLALAQSPSFAAEDKDAAPAGAAAAEISENDEIDLSGGDDSAFGEELPKVTVVADGYIDVSCDNQTVASILQQFRHTTKMNILSGDSTNLNRRVSASLNGVRWDEALKSILDLANFRMDNRNGVWFVSEKTEAEVQSATRYYVLKHASAQDLEDLFNGVTLRTSYADRNSIRNTSRVSESQSASQHARGDDKGESKSALAGRAKATAFPNTNTLVLTGPETSLNECERIIAELDRPITQVYIEARFIELSSEALHKLGVQWDQLESWGISAHDLKAGWLSNGGKAADYGTVMTTKSVNNNSTVSTTSTGTQSASTSSDGTSSASTSNNGNDNSNKTSSDNASYQGLVPTSIGDALDAGADAASMGWKRAHTFAGQLSADDFNLAISAFEKLNDGKLFSNPRIIVANGKEAKVDMTEKEPNVEVKSSRSGSQGDLDISTKLEQIPGIDRNMFAGEAFFSYGISLSVKPRVSSTGLISVEVVPTISEKTGVKEIKGASADAVYTTYPIISVKSINTEFTMKDGATAIIGGLTQTKEEDVDSGIPYLREIPWIGPKLFGWKSRQKVQREILVCVTVGIANPETLERDAGLPTNAVLGREYVEGRRLEPGQRPNALKVLTEIDTRSLDEIREDPYREKDAKDESKAEKAEGEKVGGDASKSAEVKAAGKIDDEDAIDLED